VLAAALPAEDKDRGSGTFETGLRSPQLSAVQACLIGQGAPLGRGRRCPKAEPQSARSPCGERQSGAWMVKEGPRRAVCPDPPTGRQKVCSGGYPKGRKADGDRSSPSGTSLAYPALDGNPDRTRGSEQRLLTKQVGLTQNTGWWKVRAVETRVLSSRAPRNSSLAGLG